MVWIPRALLALGLCISGVTSPAAAETLNLTAEATNPSPSFKKFLFSTPVPGNSIFTGMTGSILTQSAKASFGEMLMSVYDLPTGPCPSNGEAYDTYTQIRTRYEGMIRLYSAIVKDISSGVTSVPVEFKLPGGVPVSGCMFVILDGSIKTGGKYVMTLNIGLQFESEKASQHLVPVDLDDEYCFGMERGCGPLHTTRPDQVFTHFLAKMLVATQLISVQGNMSSSALTRDLMSQYSFVAPATEWSVRNDLYVVPDCPADVAGKSLPGDRIAPGSRAFSSVTVHGRAIASVQMPLSINLSIMLPKGACVAHLSRKMGTGGVDAEYQATLFTQPQH